MNGKIYKGYPGGRYVYVRLAIPTKESGVDWNIVEGNWKQFKRKIQESCGIAKDEAEKQIKDFDERNQDTRP